MVDELMDETREEEPTVCSEEAGVDIKWAVVLILAKKS